MTRSLIAAALALVLQQDPSANIARATAAKLAACVALYEDFTGARARSLDELVSPPKDAAFWPDGGFHLGPLPKEFRIDGRRVAGPNGAGAGLPPSARARIVPPNERLKKLFTARVHVELLRIEGEAHQRRTGAPPARREDFGAVPKDPWGRDYEITFGRGYAMVRVADEANREMSISSAESAELDQASPVEASAAERKAIVNLIERAVDDDLEAREDAARELEGSGPLARPIVEARLAQEKDPDAKRWLRNLTHRLPEAQPAWPRHRGALCAVIQDAGTRGRLTECSNNLSQLWKMQWNYMAQFGGRAKLMPPDTGGAFWLALSKTTPPLIDESLHDIYRCPASAKPAAAGATDYRGPAGDVNTFGDGDPVGACEDPGHGPFVVVLRKSGDVMSVSRDDALWKAALEKTKK